MYYKCLIFHCVTLFAENSRPRACPLFLAKSLTAIKYLSTHFYITITMSWNQSVTLLSLRWRHNGRDSDSNHQPHGCLLNRLFRRRSRKTAKLRVAVLCGGNSPVTGEFPTQRASNVENVSIWWRHHVKKIPANIPVYEFSGATDKF